MISIMTALVFVALAVNIPTAIAVLVGLKYAPTDAKCPEDVKDAKMNVNAIKTVFVFDVAVFVALLVLLQCV